MTYLVKPASANTSTNGFKVRFIDYDGTILSTQYVTSGNNAVAPTPPTHSNLTFYGWNNSYTNITRDADIGAVYNTTDGKTYLNVTLNSITGLSISALNVNKSNNATLTVDWGDGNTNTSSASDDVTFPSHTYSVAGNYSITLKITTGTGTYQLGNVTNNGIFSQSSTNYILTSVLCSNEVTSSANRTFQLCASLMYVSLSSTFILNTVDLRTFYNCHSIKAIIIPSGNLHLPDSFCYQCYALRIIVLPSTLIDLNYGNSHFYNCYSLVSIILPLNLTIFFNSIFYNCYSLQSVLMPTSVTSFGNSIFYFCYSLLAILLPIGITSIAANTFSGCGSLISVEFQYGIASIAAGSFQNNYSVLSYTFHDSTPPTLANISAFSGIGGLCQIRVPAASLTAYKTATNWSTYANYMVGY